MLAFGIRDRTAAQSQRIGCVDRFTRPGCTEPHPFAQHRDLCVGQLPVRRHFETAFATDHLQQETFVRLGEVDHRPTVAAGAQTRFIIQPQPGFGLPRTMAFPTGIQQQRTHFRLEKALHVIGNRLRGAGALRSPEQADGDDHLARQLPCHCRSDKHSS